MYAVFRGLTSHQIDPWCLYNSCPNGINFNGETLIVFLVQIFTTLFGYIFVWIACTMTLGPISMGGVLFLATPVSVASYYIHTLGKPADASFFPPFAETLVFTKEYPSASGILIFLWIGQLLGIGYYICVIKNNAILSTDWNMFFTPYYDGVFFEQQMILNRQTNKDKELSIKLGANEPKAVFICTPMYRENTNEMEQLLGSINSIAKHYENIQQTEEIYESHIFFDGALIGTQLQEFGLQLLSLLEENLSINVHKKGEKIKTPYGMCFRYTLNKKNKMPFFIHFKDKTLVKPKKRWSQVMYMNYIINHRVASNPALKNLPSENIFILMTDADIHFTPKAALSLLDVLESNHLVAAVCARTYPEGSGFLYWYQVFDYAVGHWFQKPAEHMFGCVLCCPGCFSVFRCKALQEVLETYSSLSTNGMEFLMKDMGEDRWLCTLLIEKGWRLEYCAVSGIKTFCPLSFGEFYAQRRRWTASTLANLGSLISGITKIPQGNDTISVIFIVFQALIFFLPSFLQPQ